MSDRVLKPAVPRPAAWLAWALLGWASSLAAQPLDPIEYVVRVPAAESHFIEVEATIPTGGRPSIDLMMPIWSPGYYRVEDYAAQVSNLVVRTTRGDSAAVDRPQSHRWRVATGGDRAIVLSYRLFCNQRSVTTNYVGGDYGVLNGAATFITVAERATRPHHVRIELPPAWSRAMTGLADAPDGMPNHFVAADYETLVDSPILAGRLAITEFAVAGKRHFVASAGDIAGWDAASATRDLQTFVEENARFWGELPYDKYLFLLMFRPGGGGLEHKNSNLSTVSARPAARRGAEGPTTPAPAAGRQMWPAIGLLAHEYFHLFNAKRLRPVELGPFDFDQQPTTPSLWIAEGVTSYYSGLLLTRAGIQTGEQYLASLSRLVEGLQNSPGRLRQSVAQSSLEVWNNSNSGVNPSAATVSYYNKGNVLGLLLDAKIRRLTDGRASFDDVMRLAFTRYGGERGFTPDEFRGVVEEVAHADLREWFRSSVSSTDELDYRDLLDWFGLRFTASDGAAGAWKLELRPNQTDAQKRRLEAWLAPSRRP